MIERLEHWTWAALPGRWAAVRNEMVRAWWHAEQQPGLADPCLRCPLLSLRCGCSELLYFNT
jgi:hypothetical protein